MSAVDLLAAPPQWIRYRASADAGLASIAGRNRRSLGHGQIQRQVQRQANSELGQLVFRDP